MNNINKINHRIDIKHIQLVIISIALLCVGISILLKSTEFHKNNFKIIRYILMNNLLIDILTVSLLIPILITLSRALKMRFRFYWQIVIVLYIMTDIFMWVYFYMNRVYPHNFILIALSVFLTLISSMIMLMISIIIYKNIFDMQEIKSMVVLTQSTHDNFKFRAAEYNLKIKAYNEMNNKIFLLAEEISEKYSNSQIRALDVESEMPIYDFHNIGIFFSWYKESFKREVRNYCDSSNKLYMEIKKQSEYIDSTIEKKRSFLGEVEKTLALSRLEVSINLKKTVFYPVLKEAFDKIKTKKNIEKKIKSLRRN